MIAINKYISYHNMDTKYECYFSSHRLNIFNFEWKLLPSNETSSQHLIINYNLRTVNWIYRIFNWSKKRLVKIFDLHSFSQHRTSSRGVMCLLENNFAAIETIFMHENFNGMMSYRKFILLLQMALLLTWQMFQI